MSDLFLTKDLSPPQEGRARLVEKVINNQQCFDAV